MSTTRGAGMSSSEFHQSVRCGYPAAGTGGGLERRIRTVAA